MHKRIIVWSECIRGNHIRCSAVIFYFGSASFSIPRNREAAVKGLKHISQLEIGGSASFSKSWN